MKRHQFQVIPVIDVRHGRAVRAVAGDRAAYRPLETPLAPGTADAIEIAKAFRSLFPFETLYVADLDGIEGRGAASALHERIAGAWGHSEVWVDDGSVVPLPRSALAAGCEIIKVQGSESVPSPSTRRRPASIEGGDRSEAGLDPGLRRDDGGGGRGDAGQRQAILSLDFRGDDFLGPPALLAHPADWPGRIIVMTLAHVGAGAGPDWTRLATIIAAAGPERRVYAAGGVRTTDDLRRLQAMGVAGALVATSLHNGQIKTGDLEEIAGLRS